MKKDFTQQVILGIMLLLLIITVLLPYIMKFGNHEISTDPKDWSVFATYIGGILGTLISGFTLIYLIIVNSRLYHQNRKQHDELLKIKDEELKFQKREDIISELLELRVILTKHYDVENSPYLRWNPSDREVFIQKTKRIDLLILMYFRNSDHLILSSFVDKLRIKIGCENNYDENFVLFYSNNSWLRLKDKFSHMIYSIIDYDLFSSSEMQEKYESEVNKINPSFLDIFEGFEWRDPEILQLD